MNFFPEPMNDCDLQLLSAYHDREISDDADRARVEEHLRRCPQCALQLQRWQEISRLFEQPPPMEIETDQLSRLHVAIDDAADQSIWRFGSVLGVAAASLLIIGFAWLNELPAPVRPQNFNSAITSANSQSWERIAMTLQVEVVPMQVDSIQLADARLAEWMLEGLGPRVNR